MKSTHLLFSCAALLVGVSSAYGCSSDEDPATNPSDAGTANSSSSSGSSSGGPSSSSSSGNTPEDAGTCATPDRARGEASEIQRAGAGACTTAQIDALWTACGADGASDATCASAAASAAGCFSCLNARSTAADRKTGLFAFDPDGIYAVTTVCEANAIGQADECGTKLMNYEACLRGGCGECTDEQERSACELALESGACAQFVPAVPCEDVLETQRPLQREKCGNLLEDPLSEASFKQASRYICGPAN